MRKRIAVVLLLLAFVSLQGFAALAETRTVELEGTGISFQVDSAYDVVTEANKQDYPREIRDLVTDGKIIVLYSPSRGYFLVRFDRGNGLWQHSMSGKSAEEIGKSLPDYIQPLMPALSGTDYTLSVYDGGTVQWVKTDVSSLGMEIYLVSREDRMAVVYFDTALSDSSFRQSVLDSFTFGPISLWSRFVGVVEGITLFGDRMLGTVGVVLVWCLVSAAVVGVISLILKLIDLFSGKK